MKLSIAVEKAGQINGSAMKLCTEKNYSPVPNNRGGGGGGGVRQMTEISINGGSKQLLMVEKHQYNFSCSLHLYIKQNRTFLINLIYVFIVLFFLFHLVH